MSRTGGAFRDNIEAFAVAIAMALVIRHFCIEAFRIPTGSMMPTLLGDRATETFEIDKKGRVKKMPGDRILVDKIAWLRREPRRFEVAVFQYPLNRNKNFIKRIAGMPGEWLRIVDGDLWASRDKGKTWAIQQKPAGVRDQLFLPYWPEPIGPGSYSDVKCWDVGTGWRVDEKEARFEVDAGANTTAVEFLPKVMPYDGVDNDDRAHQPYVGDVRVAFDADVSRTGELVVHLIKHGVSHRLVLGDKSYLEFGDDKTRRDLDYQLDSHEISFALSDGRMVVSVDGDENEFELPVRTQPPEEDLFDEGKWMHHAIRIEARACEVVLSGVRIARDVHYEGDSDFAWKIPDGHYFMLGDNTQSSKDSRAWVIAEAHHANGDIIRWEPRPNDGTNNPSGGEAFGGPETKIYVEADIEGHTRRFQNKDIKRWVGSRRWPFVSRGHLIGRAFSVFWPIYLPPLSTGPTRVKVIR